MPQVAILFSVLLLSTSLGISYAFSGDDVLLSDDLPSSMNFNSNIIGVDSSFFVENDVKRYLIFGSNSQQTDILENNSLYGIKSDHGFFFFFINFPKFCV